MQTINYITDKQGNKTGLLLNFSSDLETKIIDAWLNEPSEKRNMINLYLARFLYEITTDNTEKKELEIIINKLQNVGQEVQPVPINPEIVAFSLNGKELTEDEYKKQVLDICEKTDQGNYKPQNEVFRKYLAYEK
jgi:hypothetical protein